VVGGCTIVSDPTLAVHTVCPGVDLAGVNLSGANLAYADFKGADLAGANLAGSVLSKCYISPPPNFAIECGVSDFSGTDLVGTDLSGAALSACITVQGTPTITSQICSGMDMSKADLRQANLGGDDLTQVTLTGANLVGANLDGDVFHGCYVVSRGLGYESCGGTVLTGADLNGDNLSGADLSFVHLDQADLSHTMLDQSRLNGASLNGANLTGASLRGANLAEIVMNNPSSPSTATDLTGANLSYADLTGADLTGAVLTGADVTGTLLVPADVTVPATSSAGAVVTWPAPPSLPGATPTGCAPPTGSTFPIGATVVHCTVTDAAGHTATGSFQVSVVDTPPVTAVVEPPAGALVESGIWLDASASSAIGIAQVQFVLSGGTIGTRTVASAVPTIDGWIGAFDTTTVPNGIYTLQSVATDTAGLSTTSPAVSITVGNHKLTTTVLVPGLGAVLHTGSVLDASATGLSDVASVRFELVGKGGRHLIGTATQTVDGWISLASLDGIHPGAYRLVSVALDAGGEFAVSPGVPVTVG